MTRMIGQCSKHIIADWGLKHIANAMFESKFGNWSTDRAVEFFSKELLLSSRVAHTGMLDLVVKQASIKLSEVELLTRMWGPPERIVFCLRDPRFAIESAMSKFPNIPLSEHTKRYSRQPITQKLVGGDIFFYSNSTRPGDYQAFLAPLEIDVPELKFAHREGLKDLPEPVLDAFSSMHQLWVDRQ